jgi:hypothetical protein
MNLTEIAEAVLAFGVTDGVSFSDDLTQVEEAVLTMMRRIGAAAVELQLARHKLGYEGACRPCGCGQTQRFVEHRPKTIATQMGSLKICRAYYRCRHCGESALPYDQRIGLGGGPASVGLAQAAALLGIHDTFADSEATLYRLTGQRLSESTIERLTEVVGGVAARQEEQLAAGMSEWKTPAAEASPETLYVAVDGVQVHQEDGWHEAKCVACYWNDPAETGCADKTLDARAQASGAEPPERKCQTRYEVRFEGAAAFVGFVWALTCRCGLERAKRVVLLGDGAEWIWKHIGGLLKEAVCIVDWYHAMEHVWACGRALHGDGTPETQAWVKEYESLLWEGQVRAILERLQAERVRSRAKTKRAALQALITYIENQDDRLAYDRFRAAGLDIGSGRVEAACKHVVALRMKRCGMRWSKTGSQNVLSLRTAWLNGEWERLWQKGPLSKAA